MKNVFLILSALICFSMTNIVIAQNKDVLITKMVLIRGGNYIPLYRKSGSTAQEYVKPFYIDVHAVTNRQFLEFVKENPSWRKSSVKRIFADKSYLKSWQGDLEPGNKIDMSAPVTNVSWFAANAYAKWVGKRLPTVSEWEITALGIKNTNNHALRESNKKIIAWYSAKLPEKISAVESKGKNAYGVYDMFGLIREWAYDFSDMNINGAAICGAGSAGATDLRNYPAFLRYGFRNSLKANTTLANLGFRCAKTINEKKRD